jgi:hypothetical protein
MGAVPHDITPEMLVRRLTVDEYFAEWPDDRDAHIRNAMNNRRQELSRVLRDGDELWQWKAGPHVFAEHGGLVVLRQGQTVWSSMDWRS